MRHVLYVLYCSSINNIVCKALSLSARAILLRRASVARVHTRLQRYIGQLPNRTAASLIYLL